MSHRKKNSSKYDGSVYRSLVLITQFGINMIVPIGMMTALGIWLDGRFHTSFWTILLFFVGAVAGGQNIWRMAKAVFQAGDDNRASGEMTEKNDRKAAADDREDAGEGRDDQGERKQDRHG